jgi:hypothetical protein
VICPREDHERRTPTRARRADDTTQFGQKVVVAQDTTELNYTTHRAKTGLGHIGSDKSLRGVLVHTALAVGRDGVPLGVIGQKCWVRPDADFAKTVRRRQMPIEAKESYKWIEGLRWAERLSEQATQVIVVADREGDVYEDLSAPRRANVSLIVRAAQARRTTEGTSAETRQHRAPTQDLDARLVQGDEHCPSGRHAPHRD